jgi:cytochrome c oxidase cbb3-type subunit 3
MIMAALLKTKDPPFRVGRLLLFLIRYANATRLDSGAKPKPKSKRVVDAVPHERNSIIRKLGPRKEPGGKAPRLRRLASLCLFLWTGHLIAQAPAARPAPNFLIGRLMPDPAAVARGQKIFAASCGFCHGAKATGGETGPDLVRSPLALDDEGGDKIGPIIQKGVPGTAMPAFTMTEAQLKDIAAFLRDRQQAAIDRNAYPIQNVVTGDAKKGQSYFNGAGRCNTCHSSTGDLAGVGKKYDPVALQSRFLFPRTRGTPGVPPPDSERASVTVTLPSGESASGTLEYLDDFNVALVDASGDYHSFSRRTGVQVRVRDPLAAHEEQLKKYTDEDIHNVLAYLETLQ